MRLSAQSAKSLTVLAIILLLIGGMVGAPQASVLAFGLACICAVLPAFFCAGRLRFVAAVITLLAGYAATTAYLDDDPAYDAYLERARKDTPVAPSETSAPPG